MISKVKGLSSWVKSRIVSDIDIYIFGIVVVSIDYIDGVSVICMVVVFNLNVCNC